MIDAPTRTGMSLDDFLLDDEAKPYELIEGEKVYKMPNGYEHIEISQLIYDALYDYLKAHPFGRVYKEATFILPDRQDKNWVVGSRIPDVMVVSNEKIEQYKANRPERPGYPFAVIPDIVVEVVSPTDIYSDVERKVNLYLQDGVQMVWVIDPQQKAAAVHLANQTSLRLSLDSILTGGEILTGFELKLRELFAKLSQ